MTRLLFFLGAGALLMGTALPAMAQGQRDDNGVCFYRDVQYRGESWCYRAGDELADLRNRGNQISSVRVFGRARVEVFDQRDFRGASDEFDRDIPDLLALRSIEGRRTWNGRIASFRITMDRGGRGTGVFGDTRDTRDTRDPRDNRDYRDYRDNPYGNDRDRRAQRDGICVYEGPNYAGRSQCWDAGTQEENLNRSNGWNDRIGSIRVFGRTSVDLYRDAGFKGQRLSINRDVPDLGAMNWGSQISSFQVRN